MDRHSVLIILLATLVSATTHGALASYHSGNNSLKSLPLDGVPGVVLKSREDSQFLPDRVIAKLMPGVEISSVIAETEQLGVTSVHRLFPDTMIRRNRTDVDISQFYVVSLKAPVDPFFASEELSALPSVQYAEPWFIYPVNQVPEFTPNDPMFSSQWGLVKIQAPDAWDITTGDSTVVIGIVDSGVETDHPDLGANIWINPGESGLDGLGRDKRTNGADDDANGYIDDWRGWDFAGADYNAISQDNNPNPTGVNNDHGTHVGGIAAAVGNNGTGVTGTAFRCRILPVKTAADNDTRGDGGTGYILTGYEGIAYAAFMGASVVNCSWGGSGGSQVEQDIINYAAKQGTLVVAAAGNNASSAPHYPSSYANVISVAATSTDDGRASFSNFGPSVDVSAPGVSILSTVFPSSYVSWQGTSMASPFAAGVAALVKSARPLLNGVQLGEQIRATSDNIDALNPGFAGLLGRGRINGFRALTESPSSIRAIDFVLRDSTGGNNNGNPEPNETIDLFWTFINYLAPALNASVTVTTSTPGLSVVSGTFATGALNTLDSVRNLSVPIRIFIAANVAPALIASVKVTINDGSSVDSQTFSFVVNATYRNHNANNLLLTLTNNGRIGFNDYPTNSQGIGCIYPAGGANHLYEGGIIIGTSATRVVSNIRNGSGIQDNDFISRGFYELATPGIVSNQDGVTLFSDSAAPVLNRIGVLVTARSYAFSDPEDDDYVIMAYDIRNPGTTEITNLYVGQFFDWDIANYATNWTDFDPSRSLAYAWDQNSPAAPYFGVRALDSAAGMRGLVNSTTIALDRAAKWGWISGGVVQRAAGPADIHFVLSSGPFNIPAGESRIAGFAIVGGENLGAMQVNADAARARWALIRGSVGVRNEGGEVPSDYALYQNYPNPFNPTSRISYSLPAPQHVVIRLYDVTGRMIRTLVDEQQPSGTRFVEVEAEGLASGVYYYRMTAGTYSATRKLVVLR
jgi:serine protease